MRLFRLPDDDMAILEFLMRLSCLWPENPKWWKTIIRTLHWPIPQIILLPFMMWFTSTEAFEKGIPEVVQAASDVLGVTTFVIRGILIILRANDASIPSSVIYLMIKFVQNDFTEADVGYSVKIRPSKKMWTPSFSLFLLSVASGAGALRSLLMPPEQRETSAQLHSSLVHSDGWYHFVVGYWLFGHWAVVLLNTMVDGLIIIITTKIREKAAILKLQTQDLGKAEGFENQDVLLNKIIRYHNLILRLHQSLEDICSGPLLVQFFFLCFSLGAPGFRLLYDPEISVPMLCFLASYVAWVGSQLTVYCWSGDEATNACKSIGGAIYGAFHSEMDPKIAKKMVTVMAIASRPVHMTARRMIKVNRQTLLKLLRRSYSFYSTVLNLR